MSYSFHWVPARNGQACADALNVEMRTRRIVAVEKHFCADSRGVEGWAICLEFADETAQSKGASNGKSSNRIDYREVLDEPTFKVFSALRKLRAEIATVESIPLYAILTNEQLAEIAKARCSNSASSCACRKKRGNREALRLARGFAFKRQAFLKMDVRRYFDSVDHQRLKERFRGVFKDSRLLELLDRVVDSFATQPGKGLPIGTLTSQYFANFYLDTLDRYVRETLRCPASGAYFLEWL